MDNSCVLYNPPPSPPHSDSLSMDDKAALEARCLALEKSEMKLRIENNQLKEVAEVARQQGVAVEMWRKSHDLEVGALRRQLLDHETQGDDSARLAALHRQVLTLQVGEASAAKKLECANSRILVLEASLLKSEQQRDECVESVSKVRARCHSKVKQLRVVVQVSVCFQLLVFPYHIYPPPPPPLPPPIPHSSLPLNHLSFLHGP